jgi:hypothetical protein
MAEAKEVAILRFARNAHDATEKSEALFIALGFPEKWPVKGVATPANRLCFLLLRAVIARRLSPNTHLPVTTEPNMMASVAA